MPEGDGELEQVASPNVVSRLKSEWATEHDAWMERDLATNRYPELVGAVKRFGVTVAAMLIDESSEGRPPQKIQQLGEQGLAGVHKRLREWLPRNFLGSSF